MEKKNELSAHRARSIQAVLGDGFRLYIQNFWRLVRSSWMQAIIYALVFGGAYTCFFMLLLPRLLGSEVSGLSSVVGWPLAIVCCLLALILFAFAGGFSPLKEHWLTGAISLPVHWWGRWPWRLTVRGLVRLPRLLWTVIRGKQLGSLVTVSLVMFLVVLVLTVILQLPAVILGLANVEAQVGLAAGDAVDMPENLWLINVATFSVCSLLQAYIHLSTLFPLYYIWRNAIFSLRGKGAEGEYSKNS